MRRASITPQTSLGHQEPMIVVEDDEEEINKSIRSTPRSSQDMDSPLHNPYLLSPWRDPRETRKHSLPTPSCTSGITASQVRRLSERGGEGSGPSAREQAFLATLCSQPAPTSGRRHSVVTISRVPPTLFGRNRRESVAAFPSISKSSSRTILGSRRESVSGGPPPSSDHRGSVHNLQLDIMDDIVTARKVRMKMWNTSNERVCEVQPLDEGPGPSVSPMRYTGQTSAKSEGGRRYSDFIGASLPPILPPARRRASEFPHLPAQPEVAKNKKPTTGIVCTNTDLISILSSLTSSATEINQCGVTKATDNKASGNVEQRRGLLKTNRSNSFDISILHAVNREDGSKDDKNTSQEGPSSWFIKRHQPMSKKDGSEKSKPKITFAMDIKSKSVEEKANKVVWDGKSGSIVDAEAIGSAIEVFLRRGAVESPSSPSATSITPSAGTTALGSTQSKGAIPKASSASTKSTVPPIGKNSSIHKSTSPSSWFSGKGGDEDSTETCDTSLCSTLKDLFVK